MNSITKKTTCIEIVNNMCFKKQLHSPPKNPSPRSMVIPRQKWGN